MPIEFPCPQCRELLRTPDGSEGRQATCPECSAVVDIPHPAPTSAADTKYADPNNPYATPTGETRPRFDMPPRALVAHPVTFNEVMNRTWALLKDNLTPILLFGLILIAVQMAAQVVGIPLALLQGAVANQLGLIITLVILQQFWGLLVNSCVFVMSARFVILLIRGNSEPIQAMFQFWPFLFRSTLLQLIFMLGILTILVACAIPAAATFGLTREVVPTVIAGVIGFFAYLITALFLFVHIGMAQFLIVEQNHATLQAISDAGVYLRGNSVAGAGAVFVSGVLGTVVGIMTCGIGLMFLMPYLWLLLGVIYMSITGPWQSVAATPPLAETTFPTGHSQSDELHH